MLKDLFDMLVAFVGVIGLGILIICSFLFVLFVAGHFGDFLGLWEV